MFFDSDCSRYVMVKYAGNGLVSRGSLDLKLLKILYWVITLSFIAVAFGNMPLSRQVKPGFPQNTSIGMICLKGEIQYSKESITARMIVFAFPVCNLVAVCSLRTKLPNIWTMSEPKIIFCFWWKTSAKYLYLCRNMEL